jgi:DNA-binding NtrC family response regulator
MDEIGELDPRLQGKLLRALETRSFFRVGGTQKVDVNVRIVAATNRDLQQEAAEGRFRSDLYFRISTINVHLPPLRERVPDISLLADHFLRTYGGATPPRLMDDAIHALEGYSWPGNVRELRNVIERAVLLANGGVIHARDLPLTNHRISAATAAGVAPAGGAGPAVSLAELERRHIESVLTQNNWHQGKAATVLGISSKTLYRKIREYGFERPKGA